MFPCCLLRVTLLSVCKTHQMGSGSSAWLTKAHFHTALVHHFLYMSQNSKWDHLLRGKQKVSVFFQDLSFSVYHLNGGDRLEQTSLNEQVWECYSCNARFIRKLIWFSNKPGIAYYEYCWLYVTLNCLISSFFKPLWMYECKCKPIKDGL